ncbi:ABC transporter permease [Caulobacter sp. DWR2-3-1b2]|uniref:ABC transporter permease n=1 Tax=unclassified Caulobacter TaxID=2648921 RepID=UPI003CFA34A6
MLAAADEFAAIFTRWRVWFLMANQDISLRYRRSLLGPFWISLAMASLIIGLGLLYSQIFHQPFKEYVSFIAAGLVAWTLLSGLLLESCNVVMESDSHLRALPLPLSLFAARMVFRNLIIFGHNLLVVVLMLFIFQHRISPLIVLALPGLAIMLLFGFGVALILGPLSARFRDIPQVMASFVQLAFFLTPIFWRASQLKASNPVVVLNPLFHFVELIRQPLLGHVPTLLNWGVALAVTAVSLALALVVQAYTRRKLFLWL